MKHGADQLRDWMERRGLNLTEAADLLGWDTTFVSKILNKHRRPGRTNALRLEDVAGISVRSWESIAEDISDAKVPATARKRR